jgi:hypothetical protein
MGGASGGSPELPGSDLFNGTDLTGWVVATGWPSGVSRPPLDAAALFPIDEDGTLHVYRDAEDGSEQPRTALMTVASYANYKLWVEYRWAPRSSLPTPPIRAMPAFCFTSPEIDRSFGPRRSSFRSWKGRRGIFGY